MFFIHDRTGLRVSLTGPDLEAYPWPPTVAIVSFAPKVGDSFRVFINAGCRLGEILAVTNNRGMVNFEGGHIKISRMIRKGRKKDVVTPLNNALTEALKKAIKISGVGRGERIFPYSVYFVDKKWVRSERWSDSKTA